MSLSQKELEIAGYDYPLPAGQIAAFPLEERDASRLLVYRDNEIQDQFFTSLPQFLPQNATLVFNNTRVIEARLLFQKPTGGRIELFVLEPWQMSMEQALSRKGNSDWLCLIGGASKWKPGQLLHKELGTNASAKNLTAEYLEKKEDSFLIRFSWTGDASFADILHEAGAIPLPPYIKREVTESDKERYQTIFSRAEGLCSSPYSSPAFQSKSF
jgi:S-adenosylmethionine:tRNA ribosyltransferase-isomerase